MIRQEQEPQEVVLDLSALSENDLRTLQTQDPFMYHSIPSVYKAKLSLKDVDHQSICATSAPLTTQRQEASTSRSGSACSSSSNSLVSRKSRVSTECHISLLLEDMLLDDEEFFDGSEEAAEGQEDFDEFGDFLMYLLNDCSFDSKEELMQ